MANDKNTPVDFDNPEALAQELAAAEASKGVGGEKKPKEKKPRVIKVTWTADRDVKAGEEIQFDYELPVGTGQRGMLVGIPLDEMTDDQLKIEYRNANSVYYKQQKAGKLNPKAAERLEAVKAKMEERGIQPTSRTTAVIDAATVAELIKSGKIDVADIQAMLDAGAKA